MLLIITVTVPTLVAINFLLLKFSSSSVSKEVTKNPPIDKAETIRKEIQLNVQRRLEQERPITYLRVV